MKLCNRRCTENNCAKTILIDYERKQFKCVVDLQAERCLHIDRISGNVTFFGRPSTFHYTEEGRTIFSSYVWLLHLYTLGEDTVCTTLATLFIKIALNRQLSVPSEREDLPRSA